MNPARISNYRNKERPVSPNYICGTCKQQGQLHISACPKPWVNFNVSASQHPINLENSQESANTLALHQQQVATLNSIENESNDQHLLNDVDNDIHHLKYEIIDSVANYCDQTNPDASTEEEHFNVISNHAMNGFVPCSASENPSAAESISAIGTNPDLP